MAKTQHGRDLTGEEMAQMLDEFCNGAGSKDIAAFAEQVTCRTHRTLQQKIMTVFMRTIEAWAEGKGGSDLRNEAAVKLAKKICEVTDKYERMMPYI
jgi:hypothetical protein